MFFLAEAGEAKLTESKRFFPFQGKLISALEPFAPCQTADKLHKLSMREKTSLPHWVSNCLEISVQS
jgi:hypothetical protein